ncbi:hypothetical protein EDC55_11042 [Allofrancisella inopinata]|uniref:Uncharacterized protein n=1 Tax=Allofrancisella inopinata TaxID=1085647 RepID=A0AAE6YI54_9GAMM|nr:hypothetical protein [Allofrancisella inopinata]QIV96051.1 hypothetical protein E4K63_04090 [Allofrancisella inopinata]TDT71709.1 hypothetical protein EDC55_11042 [Allofrancisella inopinata]
MSVKLRKAINEAIEFYLSKEKSSLTSWQIFHHHGKTGVKRANLLKEILNSSSDTDFIDILKKYIDKKLIIGTNNITKDQYALLNSGNDSPSSLRTIIIATLNDYKKNITINNLGSLSLSVHRDVPNLKRSILLNNPKILQPYTMTAQEIGEMSFRFLSETTHQLRCANAAASIIASSDCGVNIKCKYSEWSKLIHDDFTSPGSSIEFLRKLGVTIKEEKVLGLEVYNDDLNVYGSVKEFETIYAKYIGNMNFVGCLFKYEPTGEGVGHLSYMFKNKNSEILEAIDITGFRGDKRCMKICIKDPEYVAEEFAGNVITHAWSIWK